MPLEGHGQDCDCGCCDVEEESKTPEQANVCVHLVRQAVGRRGKICPVPPMKCPNCGATMKPAA